MKQREYRTAYEAYGSLHCAIQDLWATLRTNKSLKNKDIISVLTSLIGNIYNLIDKSKEVKDETSAR